MEAESVALTPFSALAVGGEVGTHVTCTTKTHIPFRGTHLLTLPTTHPHRQATGTMAPQNGSCVKHCAAGFVPPQDWDPAARPPPGKKQPSRFCSSTYPKISMSDTDLTLKSVFLFLGLKTTVRLKVKFSFL